MRARIGNETPDKNKHTKPKCAIAVIATILPLNAMFMFLILIIGISLLSLSVSTIMINAQTSSGGISGERGWRYTHGDLCDRRKESL